MKLLTLPITSKLAENKIFPNSKEKNKVFKVDRGRYNKLRLDDGKPNINQKNN
jgi:hypothetical protein